MTFSSGCFVSWATTIDGNDDLSKMPGQLASVLARVVPRAGHCGGVEIPLSIVLAIVKIRVQICVFLALEICGNLFAGENSWVFLGSVVRISSMIFDARFALKQSLLWLMPTDAIVCREVSTTG